MTAARRGAIVGFGKVAELGHLPGWREAEQFQIVAVADPSAERRAAAQRVLPAVRLYRDHDELLAHEQLEFVDIASPPAFHGAAISACAARGLHILCEKPVATRARDYHAGRQAVAAAGVVLHPVHNWKFAEAFAAAGDVIRQGELGAVRRIKFTTERDGWAASDNDWRAQASVAGGGILVDHGWHTFYLLLALAALSHAGEQAPPRRVRAQIENRRYREADVEDTAWCEIEFDHVIGEIELSWAAKRRRTSWEISGERGSLLIEDDRLALEVGGARRARQLTTSLSQGSHHPEWFPGVIRSFAEEIELPPSRRRAQAEAEACLTLLEHAYTSARASGAVVALPDPGTWLAVD